MIFSYTKRVTFSDGDVDAWVGGKGDKGGDGGGKMIDYAEGNLTKRFCVLTFDPTLDFLLTSRRNLIQETK